MVLAQWLLKSKEYFDFYTQRMAEGDWVIMDNGAYEEEQLSAHQLIDVTARFQPDCIVLPDTPGRLGYTVAKSMEFIKLMESELDTVPETMMVLHARGGELDDFIGAYLIACEIADSIGFSKLTKSYDTAVGMTRNRRVQFAALLQTGYWNPAKVHHALGMLDGDFHELKLLAALGFDSIDSAAPVWRPLNGYRLGEAGWTGYHIAMDTEVDFSEGNILLAESTIDEIIKQCQSPSK